MAGRYGVGASLASYSGPTLAAYGQDQMNQGMSELGQAAQEETQRNAQNKVLAAQEKQSKQQLGSTLGSLAGGALAGAEWGSAAGPWGTIIGGVLGGLAGRFL